MRIHMIFMVITHIICTSSDNAGSTIFYNKLADSKCWNKNEIIKLRARKLFEELVPPKVEPNEIDNDYLKEELRYFRRTFQALKKGGDPHFKRLLREALSDTIGAHLRKDILPAARIAFYAGYVPITNVEKLHKFYDDQKDFLNTQGIGWKSPDRTPQWSNITVAKIPIGTGGAYDPCVNLVVKRDANNCIHMPLPKLDDEVRPGAIALPFKHGELMSLTSPNSNNILVKYYTMASRCILGASPEHCRHDDFVNFNNEMWNWTKVHVAPHLLDERLYPAFGGVLRIAAAVQMYGKGVSRQNIFDNQSDIGKRQLWKVRCNELNAADWTSKLYIILVIMTAIVVCLMQMCYNYMCDDICCGKNCCGGKKPEVNSESDVTEVELEVEDEEPVNTTPIQAPSAIPQQLTYIYKTDKTNQSSSKAKSVSVGSMRTQKVYDLNENTEKLMDIISDNEQGEQYSSSDESGRLASEKEASVGKGRSLSPPKIETPMSQIKLVKLSSHSERHSTPMYSTSTVVRSGSGPRSSGTLNAWSASDTSSSSSGSASSSSKCRKSRRSRNLAWARRVLTTTYRTTSHTHTTPPSTR